MYGLLHLMLCVACVYVLFVRLCRKRGRWAGEKIAACGTYTGEKLTAIIDDSFIGCRHGLEDAC